ncbi:MAG: GTPase HflX [Defluviitaleaceae bacterium]|nr:GTPase HflX [Defluviitaleaceae bacterium]MCL2835384.1 GTPase HflX [Defluviitaleaceae bacterium]
MDTKTSSYFDDFLTADVAPAPREDTKEHKKERAVLAGIEDKSHRGAVSGDIDELMAELAELAGTAGAEVAGKLVQRREGIHPGHYLGKGKIDELKALARETDADCVILNDELSPAQIRNLSNMLNMKIIDRTALILDIFAMRARSAEGRMQVEMAQLKYRLSRLSGAGAAMSRLGGGIGTRGPGETKLETDRRHIRDKLTKLRQELKEVRQRRGLLRRQRERSGIPVIALVGYTNAGKSTMMNLLSGADVFVENKLFATLDTTTRKIEINGAEVLLTDTVGFIQKLPTDLVEAFKSTLEELVYADILIHVVDASSQTFQNQMNVAYSTIASLGAGSGPVITVFNKIDKLDGVMNAPLTDPRASFCVRTAALRGTGKGDLLEAIEQTLKSLRKRITVLLPFGEGYLLDYAHKHCTVLNREHTADGVLLEVYGDEEAVGKLGMFAINT